MEQTVTAVLDRILTTRDVDTVFQTIVSVESGRVIGYEALSRSPAGLPDVEPDVLFDHAEQAGRLAELDWICRAAACRAALAAPLPADLPLFVNIEPAAARVPCPADLIDVVRAATAQLTIVAEVTERSVAVDPAGLLAAVAEMREYTSRIALDDVGADMSSQAMMSLLRPDVIKLDQHFVQLPTTPEMAAVISAVQAEAERTGAAILAEGIETPQHARVAGSIGATLGQGWLYGRPGPLPSSFDPPPLTLPQGAVLMSDGEAPFDIARRHRPVTHATDSVLLALSRHIEDIGVTATAPGVLLASFQDVCHFDDPIKDRYSRMSSNGIFTATFAAGMPPEPAKNIRGCALADDDPLTGDWNVIVIGAHFAGGLFARETTSTGPHEERRFDVIISYDRDVVLDAARPLIRRINPPGLVCGSPEAHVDPEALVGPEAHVDPEALVGPEAHVGPEVLVGRDEDDVETRA